MTLKYNDPSVPRMDQRQLEDWFQQLIKYTHYNDIVALRDRMNEEIERTRCEISGVKYDETKK